MMVRQLGNFTLIITMITTESVGEGLILNTDAYIKRLEVVVLPRVKTVAIARPYACQQDSAPYYTNRNTQSWQKNNFYDLITRYVKFN